MIFHSGYALLPNHFFRRRTLKSVNHVITQSVNHVGLDTKAAPTAAEADTQMIVIAAYAAGTISVVSQ